MKKVIRSGTRDHYRGVFCTDHDHGAAIHYRLNEPRNVLTNLFMLILSLIVALFYEKGVIISTNEANCIYFNK